ncbi:ABC transporter ATP-binding protein [Chitinasiproducens palmae]|uniref:Putative spermidine/putrescine transport system ATP-binding protein n=1 Tax=Chitinasiproducens palmae TaxID=1770053 RepID=A0A1H2PRN4_9BURK|nr:ABC transporter ATP-binding protein [Chitinasiproducens palmae]SDV48747.1 putative spermidine/putrescine transport system ATP-binding protein [Chitinasiproducens palmae]
MNAISASLAPAPRGRLELVGLRKRFGGQAGVDTLSLDIRPGEFFTLLGPSGCGKTTTLMMLAGFLQPDAGHVRLDGVDITATPPPQRGLGVVFQQYALFPHLSVRENLAFPLEMRGMPRHEIADRVGRVLELVQLSQADQLPAELSGGQQQRVAVARALVFDPPVLLMDEPLGALDRSLRLHLQRELRALQRRLGITVIYVTHDQDEAMAMSDRIAIMRHGRVAQVDPPQRLYDTPASLFIAEFLGDNNRLPAARSAGPGAIRLDNGRLLATAEHGLPDGAAVIATLRPERLRWHTNGAGHIARVEASTYFGSQYELIVDAPGFGQLRVLSASDGRCCAPAIGDTVSIDWAASDVRVFPVDQTV